jgi:hypothetical protein
MTNLPLTQTLYEEDYPLWLEKTLKNLQERNVEHLDWEHLIEEIQLLGNEQKRKVESYLRQLLKHLLFYQYWSLPDCKNHWAVEIDNFRVELKSLIKSKTLSNYMLAVVDEVYDDALRQATKKSGLKNLPVTCPYTIDEILAIDYLPAMEDK